MHSRWLYGSLLLAVAGCLLVAAAPQASATVSLPRILDEMGALERCPGGPSWLMDVREKRRTTVLEPINASHPALRAELIAAAASSAKSRSQMTREMAMQTAADASNVAAVPSAQGEGHSATDHSTLPRNHPSPRTGVIPDFAPGVLSLREMISTRGIPDMSAVGRDGQQAAWSIVRDATDDPAFQLRTAETFARQWGASAIQGRAVGELIDAALAELDKSQRYGTRYERDANGRIVRKPVDDARGIEERRKALSMLPAHLELCVRRGVDSDDRWLMLPSA